MPKVAPDVALRRIRAIELRVAGKSPREIAEELGISTDTVYSDITTLIRQETQGAADVIATARQIELERLDKWQSRAEADLESATEIDDRAKLYSALNRISERRAKLLGLDAPIKQEIDATIGSAQQDAATARALMRSYFGEDKKQSSEDDGRPN